MRYPVLAPHKCRELAQQLIEGKRPAIDAAVQWTVVGDDVDLDLRPIEELANRITEDALNWTDPDRDRYEGKVAIDLYEVLSSLPPEVLDDRGFWCYLAIRYFWDFIAWREEGPFADGNHLKYVDAASPTESVLPRMFVRAKAVRGSMGAHLAGGIPKATDFWRSHVVRVRTGTAPVVASVLAAKQMENRLTVTPLRATARKLNRVWSNVVPYVFDEGEARELIDGLWPEDGIADDD